jgi:hypothetical protein
MGDKETVLKLIHSLPSEVSLSEILEGIENIAASRENQQSDQVTELRKSVEAATILAQALAEHRFRKNGSKN